MEKFSYVYAGKIDEETLLEYMKENWSENSFRITKLGNKENNNFKVSVRLEDKYIIFDSSNGIVPIICSLHLPIA